MKKPWSGRFTTKTARSTESYTESISFDHRLWPYDIEGSIAHARMLAKQKIISSREASLIIKGLNEIAIELEKGTFRFSPSLEDIHMNIEAALIRKIGPAGGKLHTARSRNDQVALDLRLYLRKETKEIIALLRNFQKTLVTIAGHHTNTLIPGYTHLQKAQPIVLAHHLLAYVEMLSRDNDRFSELLKRIDVMPLGACAMAGTSLPTDRAYVAKLLGFRQIASNSMDAVSDRDFAIEFLSASSITMMHMSRLSEEIVLWSTDEFSFIEISDAFTTGSSIMPQKKNPDVAELARGKTGRVYGNLMGLLTLMKGLPLTYNRDMQEDKLPVFDTVDTLKGTLSIMNEMLRNTSFRKDRMKTSTLSGFLTATDIAEYLVSKGMPFRDAHEVTGKIVRHCIETDTSLGEIPVDTYRSFSNLFGKDIYRVVRVDESVKNKRSQGGTSYSQVAKQIKKHVNRLK